MQTLIEEHAQVLGEQGFISLGMVSPIDSYFVRPSTAELAHGMRIGGQMRWFFDRMSQSDIFAILFACLRYEQTQKELLGEDPPWAFLRREAEARMRELFPNFSLAA